MASIQAIHRVSALVAKCPHVSANVKDKNQNAPAIMHLPKA
jgi:hypothetical protein